MLGYIKEQKSLTRNQKEAIGLLSIGTFLEYFDLLLYTHMAVLLNDLFFSKSDPQSTALLSAFAFCSLYVCRPVGALIIGYIGDHIGRKATVIITTLMMAISCFIIAVLSPYEEIGVMAAWVVTMCRIAQGISSMGETVGAELYLSEFVKPPAQYPAVALISVFTSLGGMGALFVAYLVTSHGTNWRYAFWIGTGIAMVGALARTRLRETPEFADAKRRVKNILEKAKLDTSKLKENPLWNQKVNIKTSVALFSIQCAGPVCFYFIYIHCGNILKESFNYTGAEIIQQNLIVSIVHVVSYIIIAYLSYYVYPLIILKVKAVIFWLFILLFPYLLNHSSSGVDILLIQAFMVLFRFGDTPAMPIFYRHFPVFKRFTYTSFIYALSRACMYVLTSFGLIYLTNIFGHWGMLVIMVPVGIGFILGLLHFEKLEKNTDSLTTQQNFQLSNV